MFYQNNLKLTLLKIWKLKKLALHVAEKIPQHAPEITSAEEEGVCGGVGKRLRGWLLTSAT